MPQRNNCGSGETGWADPPFMSAKSFRLFTKIIFLMIAVPCEFPVFRSAIVRGIRSLRVVFDTLLFFNNFIKRYIFLRKFFVSALPCMLAQRGYVRKTDLYIYFYFILFLSFEYFSVYLGGSIRHFVKDKAT